jgi:VanZ family protein
MKILAKLLKYWLPVVVWALIIFNFSSHGVPKVGPSYWTDFIAKKTAHILEYGILTLLTYRALIGSGVKKPLVYWVAIFITFLYGTSDELHQSFTPTRTPTVRDVLIDTTAAILAVWIITKLLPKATGTVKIWAKRLELI